MPNNEPVTQAGFKYGVSDNLEKRIGKSGNGNLKAHHGLLRYAILLTLGVFSAPAGAAGWSLVDGTSADRDT